MRSSNLLGFYLIHDLARALRRRFDEQGRKHELTMPQWRVIAHLSNNGEPLPQVALARLADMDPMTLSRIVDRLEGRDLVERVPDPADSRAKLVSTTAKGEALVVEIRAVARQLYDKSLEGIGEDERRIMLDALARMNRNLSDDQIFSQDVQ